MAIFGEDVSQMIREILRRWNRVMQKKLQTEPEYRPLRERAHVDLIMDYLKKFQEMYESVYGLVERPKLAGDGRDIDTVYINSTAYGAKVFLGLL